MTYDAKFQLRFEGKINIPEDESECWVWVGGLDRNGYGRINKGGVMLSSHRVSWEIVNGQIPKGLSICHSCDNSKCVNPDHLWLGTQDDNMKDMAKKSRGRRPDGNTTAFLPEEECIRWIPVGEFHRLKSKGLAYGVNHKMTKLFLKMKKEGTLK